MDESPGLTGMLFKCVNEHEYFRVDSATAACPICQADEINSGTLVMLVRHGFATAAWDPPKRGTDVERVGTAEPLSISFARRSRI